MAEKKPRKRAAKKPAEPTPAPPADPNVPEGLPPAEVSEEDKPGYPWALRNVKAGKLMARTGWNGKGMFIFLKQPDQTFGMSKPAIFIKTVGGDFVPWTPSRADMLEEDWEVVG